MAPLRPPTLSHVRAFSSTISCLARKPLPPCPSYPYGRARWYKKSDTGLFGGQRIQFGNNVSEETETKTRRTWYPNIHNKKLFSVALNRHIQLKVTTRVLRTIDKVGGLDEYLLGDKTARIKELGPTGWKLRWQVLNTDVVKKRFKEQRKAALSDVGESVSRSTPTRDLDARKNADVQAGLDQGGANEVAEVMRDIPAEVFDGQPQDAPRVTL